MEAARAAEAEIARGNYRGPLHGVPFALKDIYDTAGVLTSGHSRTCIDRVPRKDATAVAKLRAAGAVLMGKLATHEFAHGGPSFDLPWPPARNPWNTAHFTGGSSSGSGAAIAAGLVPASLGSDTGGSIRGPAGLCGIAGLKPTYGLVSRAGVLPNSYSYDHCGPMARTARRLRADPERGRRPRSGRPRLFAAAHARLCHRSRSGRQGHAHRRGPAFLGEGPAVTRRAAARIGSRHIACSVSWARRSRMSRCVLCYPIPTSRSSPRRASCSPCICPS